MEIPYKYLRTDAEIRGPLQELLKAPIIPIDTETTGLDPHTAKLLLLQLSHDEMNFVIDMTVENSLTKKDKDSDIWRMTSDILTGSSTKISHGAAFEYKIVRANFGVDIAGLYCTLLAERLLKAGKTEGKTVSLEAVVPRYTEFTSADMNKKIRKDFYSGYIMDGFSEEHLIYAARDCHVLPAIYWQQIFKLQDEGLSRIAALEFEAIPVFAHMEYIGVNLDVERWGTAIKEIDEELYQTKKQIEEHLKPVAKQSALFGSFCTISIDSNDQLKKALQRLGLPVVDTKKKTLEDNLGKHPVIELLLRYRGLFKLSSGYGEGLLQKINSVTGRLHGNFRQIGADTGRSSCDDPNFQNIPSDEKCVLRDCFVPPEGYIALGADYSQQELRVLAALANEPNMLKAYWQDIDIHTMTTSQIFNLDVSVLKELLASRDRKLEEQQGEEITEAEKNAVKNRKIAKSTNFLMAYGGSYIKLAANAGIDEDRAKTIIDNYFNIYPNLRSFIDVEGARTLANMYSKTVSGRKRFYNPPDSRDFKFKKIESAIRRQGVNHIIQGSSSDITKKALVLVNMRFKERFGQENAYIWAVIHDEIQTFVKKDIVEEARRELKEGMEEAFYAYIPKDVCPIKVDTKWGHSWVH
jgi:DNA polymerase I